MKAGPSERQLKSCVAVTSLLLAGNKPVKLLGQEPQNTLAVSASRIRSLLGHEHLD
jgi:hypothetical protein